MFFSEFRNVVAIPWQVTYHPYIVHTVPWSRTLCMVAAIEAGFPQRAIQDAAYRAQLALEKNESVVVGVNAFTTEEPAPTILRVDPALEAQQKKRLAEVRAGRDASRGEKAQKALVAAARGTDNLIPKILECVRAYCTVGEIADSLRSVFGEHEEIRV